MLAAPVVVFAVRGSVLAAPVAVFAAPARESHAPVREFYAPAREFHVRGRAKGVGQMHERTRPAGVTAEERVRAWA
ncbi:hypothetical protein GCM10027445_05080 [Amycolatopsis endophytica]|uniref:Secreted protein n=1 Tax=Amycolatopsis endophytica TaxID=860233 RepID=A0A853B8S9_9PSEU|nr:hypothetical protein [Amycolatopsis endophytica]